jgi:hypothetical protein
MVPGPVPDVKHYTSDTVTEVVEFGRKAASPPSGRLEVNRLTTPSPGPLAASPSFSMLPDVRRPDDDPSDDLVPRPIAWCELSGDLLMTGVGPLVRRLGK